MINGSEVVKCAGIVGRQRQNAQVFSFGIPVTAKAEIETSEIAVTSPQARTHRNGLQVSAFGIRHLSHGLVGLADTDISGWIEGVDFNRTAEPLNRLLKPACSVVDHG